MKVSEVSVRRSSGEARVLEFGGGRTSRSGKLTSPVAKSPRVPKEGHVEMLILLIVVIVLDIAALRWGIKSTDSIDSPEWERRQRWRGFH